MQRIKIIDVDCVAVWFSILLLTILNSREGQLANDWDTIGLGTVACSAITVVHESLFCLGWLRRWESEYQAMVTGSSV